MYSKAFIVAAALVGCHHVTPVSAVRTWLARGPRGGDIRNSRFLGNSGMIYGSTAFQVVWWALIRSCIGGGDQETPFLPHSPWSVRGARQAVLLRFGTGLRP